MTYEEAKERVDCILKNNPFTKADITALALAIESLERQIPKKPYKVKEKKQNEYYCIVCNRYLGDEMELKYACLQPEYCQHCGQAIDWSDRKR